MQPVLSSNHQQSNQILIPAPNQSTNKDTVSRVSGYVRWLNDTGRSWHLVDLKAYAEFLSETHKPESIGAHLSSVRSRYRELLRDNNLRSVMLSKALEHGSAADAHAVVSEWERSILNAIDPAQVKLEVIKKRDIADAQRATWLDKKQAKQLLEAPGVDTLRGLRDTAIIATMLCLGLREFEVTALQVEDLRQKLNGSLACEIKRGKGMVQRLVPYGDMDWVLVLIQAWMDAAGITSGYVFRGFYRGSKSIRPGGLKARAGSINDILEAYPLVIQGQLKVIDPHDLRRTYADLLYRSGMPILYISHNMGHSSTKITEGYIQRGTAEDREPTGILQFDLTKLRSL